jgi:hypothetical protein
MQRALLGSDGEKGMQIRNEVAIICCDGLGNFHGRSFGLEYRRVRIGSSRGGQFVRGEVGVRKAAWGAADRGNVSGVVVFELVLFDRYR